MSTPSFVLKAWGSHSQCQKTLQILKFRLFEGNNLQRSNMFYIFIKQVFFLNKRTCELYITA